MMSQRQERGLELAKALRVRRNGDAWIVASDSRGEPYTVKLGEPAHTTCTCSDFDLSRKDCKHIYAVRYYYAFESTGRWVPDPDPSEILDPKKTYPQNWPAYNQAQTHEKDLF